MTKSARRPLIVAHRGGSPGDVDNSLAAFEHALALGADLIECDLRRSADGRIVLYHDARAGGRKLSRLSVAQIRELVPTLMTLEELLDRLVGVGPSGRLTLDLKDRGVDRLLVPILEDRPELVANLIVSTIHSPSLRRLALRFPSLRLALSRGHLLSTLSATGLHRSLAALLRPVFPVWVSFQLRWCRATAIAVQHHLIDRTAVTRYHRLGYRVYCWTVDDCPTAMRVADAGVEMLATNLPRELFVCLGRAADDIT